ERETRAALEAFQPDVVHTHDPGPLGVAALTWAGTRGRRRVLTTHQLPWFIAASLPMPLRALGQALEAPAWAYARWVAGVCDAVIAPSVTIADLLRARGIPATPLSNGIDLTRFSPIVETPGEGAALRRRFGLHPDLPIVLHIGRLDRDKQPLRALEAGACALRRGPGQLLVVGDGTERRRLERVAHGWGLRAPARFTGYLTTELPAVYRLARLTITASTVEIQSTIALEAAASGCPLVAIDIGSMPEVVRHNETGWLAQPGDFGGLCAGPGLRHRLSFRHHRHSSDDGGLARDLSHSSRRGRRRDRGPASGRGPSARCDLCGARGALSFTLKRARYVRATGCPSIWRFQPRQ
ncbi:MAG TPA: glycosyltransferase, partial [Anaerolineales bacterium]|nr:glycosyltransferase [Anaerolineales bacterium]